MAFVGYLKQGTSATIKLGPFVDDSDGNTEETALSIAQADVRLSKNGGNYAQKNDAASCTHDELGEYDCDLDATDTGTLGRLRITVHKSGALHVVQDYAVVPANVFDAMVAGSDVLHADATQINGDATAAANLEADYDGTGYAKTNSTLGTVNGFASNALTASALATDAVQEIRDAITGGAYALDTDANGRVRVVSGTSAGEISLAFGVVSASVSSINNGTISSSTFAAGAIDANALAADAITAIRDAITGGAYALDTDANGRVRLVAGTAAGEISLTSGAVTAGTISADAVNAAALASDAVTEIRDAITGGAYALDTDANGRVRLVVGTGAGEVNLSSGAVYIGGFLATALTESSGGRIAGNVQTFFDNADAATSKTVDAVGTAVAGGDNTSASGSSA